MKINETTFNCCKPKRFTTFTGNESSQKTSRKVRSKHYGQMSDDVLQLRSIMEAHKDVQNSGKMRLFKAIPAMTTGLLGLTIGLAQPGKLAAKAGAGLGFLALSEIVNNGTNKALDKIDEAKQNGEVIDSKKILLGVAKVAAGVGAVVAVGALLKNTKAFKVASKFIKKEAKQLSNEINETKLGKFFENTVAPFAKKHSKGISVARAVAPWGVIVASSLAQVELGDSLSKDIKEKAILNYAKGKMIQQEARAHYESIDAPEME